MRRCSGAYGPIVGVVAPGEELFALWPPMAIRLSVGAVLLLPVRETDLAALASMLPDDADHDPASVMFEGLTYGENRRRLFVGNCWRALGTWSTEEWNLVFTVRVNGDMVGVQSLEANHFAELRTVDSSSWLIETARGRGIGVAMRRAVLSLAFDHLGAERAVSSAREGNLSSLGVSRRLGYKDNGVSTSRSPSGPITVRHMLLGRDIWCRAVGGRDVAVSGLDGCGQWFGVEVADGAESEPSPGFA